MSIYHFLFVKNKEYSIGLINIQSKKNERNSLKFDLKQLIFRGLFL
jgi:hypothetical protein